MNLHDFEDYIDDTILYLGEDYCVIGAVGKVQSIGKNDYNQKKL